MILGTNGEKMSKSKGNVINPDDIVNEFGADTFRVYEMFMGPFDQVAAWSMESIRGCGKFLDRVWNMHCGEGQPTESEGAEGSQPQESGSRPSQVRGTQRSLHRTDDDRRHNPAQYT